MVISVNDILGQSINPMIEKVKKKYLSSGTVEVDFTMTVFWKVREKQEKKEGILLLAPDNKFRVRLGATEWVSDGNAFWQYNRKTNQVIVKNLKNIDLSMHPSQILKKFLSYSYDTDTTNENYFICYWKSQKIRPRSPYKSIILQIKKSDYTISEIKIIDKNDNESIYMFKKIKTNIPTDTNNFILKIPEGVNLLDTRK